jgi:hypothetical protein
MAPLEIDREPEGEGGTKSSVRGLPSEAHQGAPSEENVGAASPVPPRHGQARKLAQVEPATPKDRLGKATAILHEHFGAAGVAHDNLSTESAESPAAGSGAPTETPPPRAISRASRMSSGGVTGEGGTTGLLPPSDLLSSMQVSFGAACCCSISTPVRARRLYGKHWVDYWRQYAVIMGFCVVASVISVFLARSQL